MRILGAAALLLWGTHIQTLVLIGEAEDVFFVRALAAGFVLLACYLLSPARAATTNREETHGDV